MTWHPLVTGRAVLGVGDARQLLRQLPSDYVHAIVTDPPYEIAFDSGKGWDSTGVAFDPELWRQALRVLRPGGHVFSFSASRTYPRMFCAIEDVGFEMRDSIAWVYNSGFTPHANRLRPCYEPIAVARRPLEERTVAANVARWGTGELQVAAAKELLGGRKPANLILTHDCPPDACRCCPGEDPDLARLYPLIFCPKPTQDERDVGCEGLPPVLVKSAVIATREPKAKRNYHPTVKPLALMRLLVRLACPPGGLVLDMFAGSGTTGMAAVSDGKMFMGCELDPGHAVLAAHRVQAAYRGAALAA